ncbi:hypothetical protein TNCV_4949881 [Trichonephila clavipes]|nr:hypothetical protein TNCV_4949881 [Trichonephila clavipes]
MAAVLKLWSTALFQGNCEISVTSIEFRKCLVYTVAKRLNSDSEDLSTNGTTTVPQLVADHFQASGRRISANANHEFEPIVINFCAVHRRVQIYNESDSAADESLDPYVSPYAAAISNDFILMDDNAGTRFGTNGMASSISGPESDRTSLGLRPTVLGEGFHV